MDSVTDYRLIVERALSDYAKISYSYGDLQREVVFDRERNRYLLMTLGWDKFRVHGCLVHIDIIDGKIWIQRDGTEHGMARDLEAAGIPKDRIVLAFRRPEVRRYTDYAVS